MPQKNTLPVLSECDLFDRAFFDPDDPSKLCESDFSDWISITPEEIPYRPFDPWKNLIFNEEDEYDDL